MELLEQSWFIWSMMIWFVGTLVWVGWYAYKIMAKMPDTGDAPKEN